MNKLFILAMILLFIAATAVISEQGQRNLDQRLASGDKISSPICAINMMYDQKCDTDQD